MSYPGRMTLPDRPIERRETLTAQQANAIEAAVRARLGDRFDDANADIMDWLTDYVADDAREIASMLLNLWMAREDSAWALGRYIERMRERYIGQMAHTVEADEMFERERTALLGCDPDDQRDEMMEAM
jgi:hypothetical protein